MTDLNTTPTCAAMLQTQPSIALLQSRMWSLSFEEDSDSGLYLSHLDFCVILLQSIWLFAIYFTTKTVFVHYCAPSIRRIL